jgi:hypothetical protein
MVPRPDYSLSAASWDPVAEDLLSSGRGLRAHSVFERALNLATATGELVGLVGPGAGNGPATVVLRRVPRPGFVRLLDGATDSVRIERGWLLIGSSLRIDLGQARRWEHASLPDRAPDDLPDRLANAEEIARRAAPAGGLTALLSQLERVTQPEAEREAPVELDQVTHLAWTALRQLLPAWPQGDAGAVERAASRLAGLGPGLTPSGDDLLAGLLVGTAWARGAVPTDLGRACVAAAVGRTTDISVARIRHAARGALEEIQERVLAALYADEVDRAVLEQAVVRAARWGHASGADTLVGVFLGTRVGPVC